MVWRLISNSHIYSTLSMEHLLYAKDIVGIYMVPSLPEATVLWERQRHKQTFRGGYRHTFKVWRCKGEKDQLGFTKGYEMKEKAHSTDTSKCWEPSVKARKSEQQGSSYFRRSNSQRVGLHRKYRPQKDEMQVLKAAHIIGARSSQINHLSGLGMRLEVY